MNLPMIVVMAFCAVGSLLMAARLAYLDGRDEMCPNCHDRPIGCLECRK